MHPNLKIEAPIRLAQAEHDSRVSVGNTRELKDQLNATNQGDTPVCRCATRNMPRSKLPMIPVLAITSAF